MRISGFPSWLAVLAVLAVSACDGKEDCTPRMYVHCEDGVSYWMDSCGNLDEVKDFCECGCEPDHSECQRCDCTCSETNDCCDGCEVINEGGSCDDGDPATKGDTCYAGVCSGWAYEIEEPAQPAPVALRSWECPAGWIQVEHESLLDEGGEPFSWCEPPAMPRLRSGSYLTPLKEGEQDGDRPICDPAVDGTFPVIGQTSCQPLGDPCPAGEWPDVPVEITGTRIFVKAGATGGNGTQTAPFGTVGAGVAAAQAGDVLVIGAGTYPESVTIDKDLTLWGACVRQAVIDAPGPHAGLDAGAIFISGGVDVSVHNLRISGAQVGVRVMSAGANVTLQGVWIHQATRQGVAVDTGSVHASGVLVDSMHEDDQGTNGRAFSNFSGAQLRLESSTIENVKEIAIQAADSGTTLVLDDVAVRHTQSQEAALVGGYGLQPLLGASATVTRGLFEGNRSIAIVGAYEGTYIALEDVTVRDTESEAASLGQGQGLRAQEEAHLVAKRVLVERNRSLGVFGARAGIIELEDVVIKDTRPEEADQKFGRGLHVQESAQATLTRGLIEGNYGTGAFANQEATLDLVDVVVRDTLSHEEDPSWGCGLNVQEVGHATVTRGLFEGNRRVGINVASPGSTVDLTDVTVRDTESQESTNTLGFGMSVRSGSQVTLSRGLFERNRAAGIFASAYNTSLSLEDVTVRDTRSQETDLTLGRGLEVSHKAQVLVTRGLFEGNREAGICASSLDTALELNHVAVRGTLGRDCASLPGGDPRSCLNLDMGTGLGVYLGAIATIAVVEVSDSHHIGLQLAISGTVVGEGLAIRNNPIGANIQDVPDGYVFEEDVAGLLMAGNRDDLDHHGHPVPEIISGD